MTTAKDMLDDDGKLPAWAFPGGYPISYMASDGELVCTSCANGGDFRTESADDDDERDGFLLNGAHIEWECDDFPPTVHGAANIETAYGKVDA